MKGKRLKKAVCMIIAVGVLFLNFTYVQAGEDEAEEKLFSDFQEMDYYIFIETNVGYGVSGDYYRYGIYGNMTSTAQAGEELYFMFNEKVIGEKLALYSHEEWLYNPAAFIQNISPDLKWIVSRQYIDSPVKYTDTLYYKNQKLDQKSGCAGFEAALFAWRKTEDGQSFELEKEERIREYENLVIDIWDLGSYIAFLGQGISCMDEYGKLLAISEPDNQTIRIYDTEDWELLHRITIKELDANFPIEISQIEGNEESGWLIFSHGDCTYRMEYPQGKREKIGEFMFATSISPDGKYRAYCTANGILDEAWMTMPYEKRNELEIEFYRRWDEIPAGWYIEELATGNQVYIPVETWKQDARRLEGGRCVWIQKDKLCQVVLENF